MSFPSPRSKSLLGPITFVLGLLVMDGIISLALVSNMVAFLHGYGKGPFEVTRASGGGTFFLAGHPQNLVTNQGHTTNAAGGTAVVLIGFGGLIALLLERRSRKLYGKSSKAFYTWAVFVVLSCLLSLAALIYTFVESDNTEDQAISLPVAQDNPFPALYPLDRWTPENWYTAVLDLPLVDPYGRDRNGIEKNLRLMRGWRWNTIPLFLLGLTLSGLVLMEVVRSRRVRKQVEEAERVHI
ncbi:hypothetical protein QBC38DRAFT_361708 [Podospora fimiseda]|uniref:Uncharacterized protein n=1 Tax=Podospora fimiseda TaxID=252190 RepID=A0AAN7H5L8_9PEZI|nr:hypothetical protein QBC38DRAFT_361708 [Podospora fimiseda]